MLNRCESYDGYGYYCQLRPNHDGLHSAQTFTGDSRVWAEEPPC